MTPTTIPVYAEFDGCLLAVVGWEGGYPLVIDGRGELATADDLGDYRLVELDPDPVVVPSPVPLVAVWDATDGAPEIRRPVLWWQHDRETGAWCPAVLSDGGVDVVLPDEFPDRVEREVA